MYKIIIKRACSRSPVRSARSFVRSSSVCVCVCSLVGVPRFARSINIISAGWLRGGCCCCCRLKREERSCHVCERACMFVLLYANSEHSEQQMCHSTYTHIKCAYTHTHIYTPRNVYIVTLGASAVRLHTSAYAHIHL